MIYKVLQSIIFVAIIIGSTKYSLANPAIYVDNLNDALILSQEIKKDIILIFSADWCNNCKLMKNDLKSNPEVLEDKIICIVDTTKNKTLTKQYKVKSIPDCRVLKNKKEIKKRIGYDNIDNFKNWLEKKE